jgi:hypothetical protein
MHKETGHFGEARTLSTIKPWFLWHDRTNSTKEFVRACDKCQLTKQIGNLRSSVEGMKSILVCDLFYHVTLNTAGPLPKMFISNKYVLIVVDHSYDILGARMLWKPKEARILKNFIDQPV